MLTVLRQGEEVKSEIPLAPGPILSTSRKEEDGCLHILIYLSPQGKLPTLKMALPTPFNVIRIIDHSNVQMPKTDSKLCQDDN